MSLRTSTNHTNRILTHLLLIGMLLQSTVGCSRRFWRLQAQNDTYDAISEKMNDPHWQLPRINLTADPRSRFHDPYDPDCAPLPPDDPSAHCYMHCSDGNEGYKRWHDLGATASVENPHWLEPYSTLTQTGNPVDAHNQVKVPKLNLQDSVELTYIHSRDYQSQLEEVYLTALELTEQRYLLNTRFDLTGVPGAGGALLNSNRMANGRTTRGIANGLGIQQALPSGGQFVVDILNTVTWAPRRGLTATSLGWQLAQPLLEGAGRKIRMEVLVQAERNLLYQVRDMARFRQTIFTDVATDYLRIQQQAQNIINQENNIRQLEAEIEKGLSEDQQTLNKVSEELREFPEGAEIPESIADKLTYSDQNLFWKGSMSEEEKAILLGISDDPRFQRRAQQLIRWRERGTEVENISLNVRQLITRKNTRQNQLEGARRQLADLLDSFKIRLGLPPDIEMSIDESFVRPFRLIDDDLRLLIDSLREFQLEAGPLMEESKGEVGQEDVEIDPTLLRSYVKNVLDWKDRIGDEALGMVRRDFVPVRELLEPGEGSTAERQFDSKEERDRVIRDLAGDLSNFRILESEYLSVFEPAGVLEVLLKQGGPDEWLTYLDRDSNGTLSRGEIPVEISDFDAYKPSRYFTDEDTEIDTESLALLVRDMARIIREQLLLVTQSLQVVQAGLRVETISLNPFTIEGIEGEPSIEEVVRIGLENRHDLMNERAAVMDARRQMEVAANALKALLDLNVSGNVDLDGGNNTDSVAVSLNFKAPLDHVQQRNDYNAALIAYQRARRNYMAAEDNVKSEIRSSWRQLQVSRQRMEIDRQTVRNAALEYDNVSISSSQDNSLSLLNALDSVLNAQNSLVSDWITYETNRLNIFRDMGIMVINQQGVWQDRFYLQDGPGVLDTLPPPEVLNPELPDDLVPPSPAVQQDLPVIEPPTNE